MLADTLRVHAFHSLNIFAGWHCQTPGHNANPCYRYSDEKLCNPKGSVCYRKQPEKVGILLAVVSIVAEVTPPRPGFIKKFANYKIF